MEDNLAKEINREMKKNLEVIFEKAYVPRIQEYLDTRLQKHMEQIIEKKIEERFAFAIELLRSVNKRAFVDEGEKSSARG